MANRLYEQDDAPSLHPFPEGWYFVASRAALARRKLIGKTWLGARIVAWCDGDGRLCVAGAACPHLGSDLEPDPGDRLRPPEVERAGEPGAEPESFHPAVSKPCIPPETLQPGPGISPRTGRAVTCPPAYRSRRWRCGGTGARPFHHDEVEANKNRADRRAIVANLEKRLSGSGKAFEIAVGKGRSTRGASVPGHGIPGH